MELRDLLGLCESYQQIYSEPEYYEEDLLVSFFIGEGYVETEEEAFELLEYIDDELFEELLCELTEIHPTTGKLKGSGKSPKDTAAAKAAQIAQRLRNQNPRKPLPPEQISQLTQRSKRLSGISRALGSLSDVSRGSRLEAQRAPGGRLTTGYRQKPEMRDPRLGPTRAQQSAERVANTILGGTAERGATFVSKDPTTGKTTRMALNATMPPVNIRSDVTRKERRSGSSRTTERPEVGRSGRVNPSSESSPTSFRKRG